MRGFRWRTKSVSREYIIYIYAQKCRRSPPLYYTHVYNDNTIYLRRAGGVCLAMTTTTRTVGRREWVGTVSVRERRWYVWRASGGGWRKVGNTRLNNNVRIIQSSVPVKPSYRRRFYPVIAFRRVPLYITLAAHLAR